MSVASSCTIWPRRMPREHLQILQLAWVAQRSWDAFHLKRILGLYSVTLYAASTGEARPPTLCGWVISGPARVHNGDTSGHAIIVPWEISCFADGRSHAGPSGRLPFYPGTNRAPMACGTP